MFTTATLQKLKYQPYGNAHYQHFTEVSDTTGEIIQDVFTLYSYGTEICRFCFNHLIPNASVIFEGPALYSQTTKRHVYKFFQEMVDLGEKWHIPINTNLPYISTWRPLVGKNWWSIV